MSRTMQYLVRTSIIAIAMVFMGWVLGILFPAEQVAGEPTGLLATLILPWVSSFILAAALAYPISRSP